MTAFGDLDLECKTLEYLSELCLNSQLYGSELAI